MDISCNTSHIRSILARHCAIVAAIRYGCSYACFANNSTSIFSRRRNMFAVITSVNDNMAAIVVADNATQVAMTVNWTSILTFAYYYVVKHCMFWVAYYASYIIYTSYEASILAVGYWKIHRWISDNSAGIVWCSRYRCFIITINNFNIGASGKHCCYSCAVASTRHSACCVHVANNSISAYAAKKSRIIAWSYIQIKPYSISVEIAFKHFWIGIANDLCNAFYRTVIGRYLVEFPIRTSSFIYKVGKFIHICFTFNNIWTAGCSFAKQVLT